MCVLSWGVMAQAVRGLLRVLCALVFYLSKGVCAGLSCASGSPGASTAGKQKLVLYCDSACSSLTFLSHPTSMPGLSGGDMSSATRAVCCCYKRRCGLQVSAPCCHACPACSECWQGWRGAWYALSVCQCGPVSCLYFFFSLVVFLTRLTPFVRNVFLFFWADFPPRVALERASAVAAV